MKRIGGSNNKPRPDVPEMTVDGRTPQQQLVECAAWLREYEAQRLGVQRPCWGWLATPSVARLGDLSVNSSVRAARVLLARSIFPLVTPLALDPAHPFPFVSNLSLNLLVAATHAMP
jgi:polyphosphate kinase